jgi:hypothetical protein
MLGVHDPSKVQLAQLEHWVFSRKDEGELDMWVEASNAGSQGLISLPAVHGVRW